jgi:hypothetical protein
MKCAAGVIGLIFLLVACGGNSSKPLSRAAYVKAVWSIAAANEGPRHNLKVACVPKGSPSSEAFRFPANTQSPAAIRNEASALAKLTPPAAVASAHHVLVQALQGLARELTPFSTRGGCTGMNVKQAMSAMSASFRQFRQAQAQFRQAGYTMPPA